MTSPTEKMPIATIEVVGEPVGQPRERARAFVPKNSTKHTARVYPAVTIGKGDKKRAHPILKWKRILKGQIAPSVYGRVCQFGALRVDVTFRFSRPNNHFGTGRNKHKLKASAPTYHKVKPDRDNADKPVLDALEKSGFVKNDMIASDGRIRKLYVQPGESPGCTITIYKLED